MPVLYSDVTARADVRHDVAGTSVVSPLMDSIRPLRPLSGTEPLDLGLTMFRVLAKMLVPLTILFHLPIEAVDLWWRIRTGNTDPISVAGMPLAMTAATNLHGILVPLAHSIALSMLGLATGMLLRAGFENEPVRVRELIVRVLKRSPTALVITVVSLVGQIVVSCVPVVGFVIMGTVTSTTSVVAGAERIGPLRSLRRSFDLARANARFAGGTFLGGLLIVWIVRGILSLGPLGLVFVLGLPEVAFSIVGNLSAVTLLVLQPLTATMATAAYLALRIRSEGLDLTSRISGVGGAG